MRSLVVDDDLVSRTKLKMLLAPYGDSDGAADGELALKLFEKAHEEGAPYDLITMDINMPGMSGREALQQLREWEKSHDAHLSKAEAKVLMVTVMNTPKDIMSSFREGCEWYLVKPVTPENLKEALDKLELPGGEARASSARPIAGRSSVAKSFDIPLRPPQEISFDGVREMSEHWELYATSTLELSGELEANALNVESNKGMKESLANAKRILHTMKGESGMIGATVVQDVLHKTEWALEEHGADPQVGSLLLEVVDWIRAVIEYAQENANTAV